MQQFGQLLPLFVLHVFVIIFKYEIFLQNQRHLPKLSELFRNRLSLINIGNNSAIFTDVCSMQSDKYLHMRAISPWVCTTRLSLSLLLAARLVSNMKVCIREQISRGAMLTSWVTQLPRSILPMGSTIINNLNILQQNIHSKHTHNFLILWIFPESQCVTLQHHPPPMPGSKTRHVVKHRQKTTICHLYK